MKNFVQREMLNYEGPDLEDCCRFLGAKFLDTYPQVEGVQMSAVEIPYAALPNSDVAFAPAGPECATARLELNRAGVVEIASGIRGFKLLRLGGSAFHGFVRDQYTTLPDITNRPLHMWLDLEWLYTDSSAGFSSGAVTAAVRRIVREVFNGFESGSIQQVIYQIGTQMLADIPGIAEVHLEANNRTWDTIAERGEEARRFHRSAASVRRSWLTLEEIRWPGSRRMCSIRRADKPAQNVVIDLHFCAKLVKTATLPISMAGRTSRWSRPIVSKPASMN